MRLWTCLLIGALASPGWAASVQVNRIEAGEQPIYDVGSIHVESFGGPAGLLLAERVRNGLMMKERGTIDRKIPLLQEGLRVDPFTVAGLPTDADAVLSGSSSYTHEYNSSTRTKKNKDGSSTSIPCLRLEVTVTTRWELLATSDGGLLLEGSNTKRQSERECGGNYRNRLPLPAVLAEHALIGDGIGTAIAKLAAGNAGDVAPVGRLASTIVDPITARWVRHRVSLKGTKGNKEVVKLAAAGDWEQAVCLWRDATDPESLHNLGALYEVKGWYPMAERAYQRALDVKGKGYAAKGLARVRSRMSMVNAMRDGYGMPYEQLLPPENDICRAYL